MTLSVLSLARRHVLRDLYERCEPIEESIPVYFVSDQELVGHADQSLGHYADAFSFHLDPDFCKKLSGGQFGYTIGYEPVDPKAKGSRTRLKLTSITLTPRKTYEKPVKSGAPIKEKVVEPGE